MAQRSLVWLFLFAILGLACTAPAKLQPAPGGTASAARDGQPSMIDLGPSAWKLQSLGEEEALPGVVLTLRFGSDGEVSGSGGANGFRASVELGEGRFRLGPIQATKRARIDPPGVMDQENRFFAALRAADAFRFEGDRLILSKGDRDLLHFEVVDQQGDQGDQGEDADAAGDSRPESREKLGIDSTGSTSTGIGAAGVRR